MKKLIVLSFLFLSVNLSFGQTDFDMDSDVLSYLGGKTFSNEDQSMKVKIDYASDLGSWGIILNGKTTHFNLDIQILSPTKAVITGESLNNPDGVINMRINSVTNCIENEGDYYCLKK